jgi:hypothetical protein
MINDKTDLVTMVVMITVLAACYWGIGMMAFGLFAGDFPSFGLLWWLSNLAGMITVFSVDLSENRAAKARRVWK